MKNKTESINADLERVIDQVGSTTDRLNEAVKKVDFNEEWGPGTVKKIKAYLGFTKNFSDLAKVRLSYTKVINNLNEETEE